MFVSDPVEDVEQERLGDDSVQQDVYDTAYQTCDGVSPERVNDDLRELGEAFGPDSPAGAAEAFAKGYMDEGRTAVFEECYVAFIDNGY